MKIPRDVLLQIFEYLPISALKSCSGVCREWNFVSKTDRLWRRFLVSDERYVKQKAKRKKIGEFGDYQKVTNAFKTFSRGPFETLGHENWRSVKQIKIDYYHAIIAFESNTIRMFDEKHECRKTLSEYHPFICFESSADFLYYGGASGISVWNHHWLERSFFSPTTSPLQCMKLVENRLFCGTKESGIDVVTCPNSQVTSNVKLSPNQKASIEHLDVSKDASTLFCVNSNGGATIWDLTGNQCIHRIEGSFDSIQYQHPFIFCGCKEDVVQQWDIRTFSLVESYDEKRKRENPLAAFYVDGEFLFTANSTGRIKLWDLSKRSLIASRETSPNINSISCQKGDLVYGENSGLVHFLNFSVFGSQ